MKDLLNRLEKQEYVSLEKDIDKMIAKKIGDKILNYKEVLKTKGSF